MKKTLFAAFALLLGRIALAQTATLNDFAWLAGRWVDDAGGNLSEETWTAPAGDAMQGMWRYVVGGKTQIYEMLTVSAEDGGLVAGGFGNPPRVPDSMLPAHFTLRLYPITRGTPSRSRTYAGLTVP